MGFKKGDRVQWDKHKEIRSGEIVAVVPGGKSPAEFVNLAELKKNKIKPLGLITTLDPRDHESYLVECFLEKRRVRAIFWPDVSVLTKAVK